MHWVLFGENDVSAAGSRLYIIIDIHNTPYRNDLDGSPEKMLGESDQEYEQEEAADLLRGRRGPANWQPRVRHLALATALLLGLDRLDENAVHRRGIGAHDRGDALRNHRVAGLLLARRFALGQLSQARTSRSLRLGRSLVAPLCAAVRAENKRGDIVKTRAKPGVVEQHPQIMHRAACAMRRRQAHRTPHGRRRPNRVNRLQRPTCRRTGWRRSILYATAPHFPNLRTRRTALLIRQERAPSI